MSDRVRYQCPSICKVDSKLGLVFGYAIACNIYSHEAQDYQPYFDTQGDHIPDEVMLRAATDFAMGEKTAGLMHSAEDGEIVFLFPMTLEIAHALGVVVPMTGLLIAIKPSPEVFSLFQEGFLTGFSIGGSLISSQEV